MGLDYVERRESSQDTRRPSREDQRPEGIEDVGSRNRYIADGSVRLVKPGTGGDDGQVMAGASKEGDLGGHPALHPAGNRAWVLEADDCNSRRTGHAAAS